MSHIKLSCGCGSTFDMRCGEFINPGGRKDELSRVFIAEVRAAEWLNLHDKCREPSTLGRSIEASDCAAAIRAEAAKLLEN